MALSNDLKQMRLPFDRRPPVKQRPPWAVDIATEAAHRLRWEQAHADEMRADFIASICRPYRANGAKIRLEKADAGPQAGMLHLFVDGECKGYFDLAKQGLVFHVVNKQ